MLLMSTTTSMVLLCQSTFNNLLVSANSKSNSSPTSFSFSLSFSLFSSQKNYTKSSKRSRLCSCRSISSSSRSRSSSFSLVPNAKERKKTRKQSWWYKFFLDDDGNWLGLKEDDMQDLVEQGDEDEDDDINSNDDDSKFEAWKQRAQAITELREAQEDMRNQEARSWEDWLAHDDGNGIGTFDSSSSSDWFNFNGGDNGLPPQSTDPTTPPQNGLVRSVRNFLLGSQDDTNDDDDDADLLYEDRVFRYASINSAKFLVVLIFVPWALDFLFHDYLLMPFLDRYVNTVPLAAQMLDVRRNQKLEIIEQLKMEKARLRLEVQIGKSPPLSDDQAWWELRDKALELREEKRLQNRGAFANIWSDMVFGISLFILLYSNQSKVALLKFTGYKIINNISDTGKAFLIILITDIFLGYHSESGWQTLLEIIVEHYGLEVDQSAITIFICLVPVIIDACVKLWLFKFLPRLSPKVANIFREMKRH